MNSRKSPVQKIQQKPFQNKISYECRPQTQQQRAKQLIIINKADILPTCKTQRQCSGSPINRHEYISSTGSQHSFQPSFITKHATPSSENPFPDINQVTIKIDQPTSFNTIGQNNKINKDQDEIITKLNRNKSLGELSQENQNYYVIKNNKETIVDNNGKGLTIQQNNNKQQDNSSNIINQSIPCQQINENSRLNDDNFQYQIENKISSINQGKGKGEFILNKGSQITIESKKPLIKQINAIEDQENLSSFNLKETLKLLVAREEEVMQQLVKRSARLHDLVNIFADPLNFKFENPTNFSTLKEAMSELSQSLVTASRTEVELGQKIRDFERVKLEFAQLQTHSETLTEKNAELQKIIAIHQQKIRSLEEENNKLMKYLNIEKKLSREGGKKVNAMEKRIEFILENDVNINLNQTDRLRITLNELLRENESLKRDLSHKNQEIERMQGKINHLNITLERLLKKLDNIKKNPSTFANHHNHNVNNNIALNNTSLVQVGNVASSSQIIQFNQQALQQQSTSNFNIMSQSAAGLYDSQQLLPTTSIQIHQQQLQPQSQQVGGMHEGNLLMKKDDLDLLQNFVIPKNLDFRFLSLRTETMNLVSDIIDLGTFAFSNRVVNQIKEKEEKMKNVQSVAEQFLAYKELSEKLNWILSDLDYVRRTCTSREEIVAHVNKHYSFIFNAKRLNLWLVDQMTGVLCTFDSDSTNNGHRPQIPVVGDDYKGGKQLVSSHCLYSKGIIGEVFSSKEAMNIKNASQKPLLHLIYEDSQSEKVDFVESTLLVPIFEMDASSLKISNQVNQQKGGGTIRNIHGQVEPQHQLQGGGDVKKKVVSAVLEISNSSNDIFNFDDEYFSIIVSRYLSAVFDSVAASEALAWGQALGTMQLECYGKLLRAGRDKFLFSCIVKDHLKKMFNIGNSKFFFIEKKKEQSNNFEQDDDTLDLVEVKGSGQRIQDEERYNISYGIAGLAAREKKAMIVNDVKFSSQYNQLVDLYSLLPVYVIPIVHTLVVPKNEDLHICYGVVEVTLKHACKSILEKDCLINPQDRLFGLQDPLEIELKRFIDNIVLTALMKMKEKDQ